MSERELTCSELIEFILAYLEDDLDASERARFEQHLEACEGCAEYLASYGRTIALGREALRAGGPPDLAREAVPEDLVRAVMAARRRI